MATGVYCGVGNHDACMLPSCACGCHRAHPHLVTTAAAPPPRLRASRAVDELGRRICECCGDPIERRSTPGRYPNCHPECAA